MAVRHASKKSKLDDEELDLEMLNRNEIKSFSIKDMPKNIETVRIGVVGDGSCFLYALLYTLCGSDYWNLNYYEQKSIQNQLRKQIANSLPFEKFITMENVLNQAYFKFFSVFLPEKFDELKAQERERLKLEKKSNLSEEEQNLLQFYNSQLVDNKSKIENFKHLSKKNELVRKLIYPNDKEGKLQINDKMTLSQKTLIQEIQRISYNYFLEMLKKGEIEDNQLYYISQELKVNIIIINATHNNAVYNYTNNCIQNNNPYVFIWWNGVHYEAILQRLENGNLQTQFTKNSVIMQRFFQTPHCREML